MYVRDARNRDEVWLLDHIEELGLDDTGFRSRDYVIAVDETSNDRVGFGRIRIHKEPDACEVTGIGVLEGWRGQGVGAHVVERLVGKAADEGFDEVYAVTGRHEYLEQFGFERIEDAELPASLAGRLEEERERAEASVVPLRIDVDAVEVPSRLREAFKNAARREPDSRSEGAASDETEELAEELGIDPDSATYKYDTGG